MFEANLSPAIRNLRTVFLDRDGVVNEKKPEGQYVCSWDEFHLLRGVPEAIARLNRAGIRVVVVSNQRGIALKLYSIADVHSIHARLQDELTFHGAHIDAFYFCPHDKNECNCRKPLPGLFEEAVRQFEDISAATSVMIGDSRTDIEFGARLGMHTILIQGALNQKKPETAEAHFLESQRFASLVDAVDALLSSY